MYCPCQAWTSLSGCWCLVLQDRWYKFVEVTGHCKHPWNDLADSLARWTVTSRKSIGHVDWQPFHELLFSGQWAWLFDAKVSLHNCLPPGSHGGVWQFTPSFRKISLQAHDAHNDTWTPVRFQIASANVLALGEPLHDLPVSGGADGALRLDKQWHASRVSAVGLQESRRDKGRIFTDYYFGFSSGGQLRGKSVHYGCELWLHKHLPIDACVSLTFADFSAVVVIADPGSLVVNLHHSTDMSFVVLHVPCKTSSCMPRRCELSVPAKMLLHRLLVLWSSLS